VYRVGNTVVDAARWALDRLDRRGGVLTDAVRQLLHDRRLVLVTAHRRESWGAPIAGIARAVGALAERHPDLVFVWPLHPNPDLRRTVGDALSGLTESVAARVRLTDPLGYPELLTLLRAAWLVMTDSGGIQEEAAALDRPLLVLRETTERPEVIEAGGGALVGTDPGLIERWVDLLANDEAAYATMRCRENPFGDGTAGQSIADVLGRELGAIPTSVFTPRAAAA
ncbi:MAG TPA: UDP-N-acetylglucosamine 2-epimerase, partial [Rhodothermales bacterium]|nr:UDP-N-acetylglucosamine 2-epimerase [Rhodothermales bacterium]